MGARPGGVYHIGTQFFFSRRNTCKLFKALFVADYFLHPIQVSLSSREVVSVFLAHYGQYSTEQLWLGASRTRFLQNLLRAD